ncbi:MAG: 50S ribosomal protein L29 [Proteobacteria bacterium]|nr:50S ribosomal protein L29 [Pseudomonadota bacterium]
MKASELRQLSKDDLRAKIRSLEENLFRLRCNKTIGQLEDTSTIRFARKDIARAKTVLNET